MKKTVALILAIVFSLGCSIPVFASDIQPNASAWTDCDKEAGFLYAIGIFSEDELRDAKLDGYVTRGDFAKKLALLLKTENTTNGNLYFYDTDECSEVNALAERGIFKGNPDGFFYPQKNITETEAVIAVVRALGYEPYVAARGGNVSEYLFAAKRLDLLSCLNGDETLSFAEGVVLLYNMLLTNVYEIQSISDDGIGYTSKGDTLLWTLYDTYSTEGVVTADRFTGLYSETALADNQIAINNKAYNTTMKTPWEYIGQNVTAYVRKIDDVDTVIHMESNDEMNDTITLLPGEYTYKNQVISYDENGKTKKVIMPDSMAVIKNHQAVSGDYDKAFDIKLGCIRLYKNEYAGKGYSVAVIDSAETALAELVDFDYNIIYTGNENVGKISYYQDGTNYVSMVTLPSGKSIGGVQIKRGDLLSVYRSENGLYTKIYLCADYVSGTVTAVMKKNGNTYAEIDGNKYELSKAFVGTVNITANMTGKFYFDEYGNIAYYSVGSIDKDVLYGYVYDIADNTSGIKSEYKIIIFDENGVHGIYKFADKVRFDGTLISASDALSSFINPKTGAKIRKLVMFTVNTNGEVNYMDTPASNQQKCEAEGTVWEEIGISSLKFSSYGHLFAPLYPIKQDRTKVFVIPPETVEDPKEDSFDILTYDGKQPFHIGWYYNVGCYKNTPQDPYMDVLLYVIDEQPDLGVYYNMLVADKITTVSDKVSGDTRINMDCYINYYKTNMNFAKEIAVTKTDKTSVTITDEQISQYIGEGDAMYYSVNAAGDIARIYILYDCDRGISVTGNSYSFNNYSLSTGNFQNNSLAFGDVSDIYKNPSSDNSSALITLSKNGEDKLSIPFIPSKLKPLIYDSTLRDNKMYIGTIDDIITLKNTANESASKILIQFTGSSLTTVVIYK